MTRGRKAPLATDRLDPFGDVASACRTLARNDHALARALSVIGTPHIRRRTGGFGGLFRIIVEQQVSVPAAQAILARCADAVDPDDPAAMIACGEAGLRAQGLSRPKARYVLGIADAVTRGRFCFDDLAALNDADALAALQRLKGIGPWSAAIYLLFCDGRVDIWPPRDVALKAAYGTARGRDIDQATLDEHAAHFAPFRGIAAHILWTYYARCRGRTPI